MNDSFNAPDYEKAHIHASSIRGDAPPSRNHRSQHSSQEPECMMGRAELKNVDKQRAF
jgi:hypothetical protein